MLPASLRPRLSTMSAPSPALVRGSVGRLRPPLSESAAIQGASRVTGKLPFERAWCGGFRTSSTFTIARNLFTYWRLLMADVGQDTGEIESNRLFR